MLCTSLTRSLTPAKSCRDLSRAKTFTSRLASGNMHDSLLDLHLSCQPILDSGQHLIGYPRRKHLPIRIFFEEGVTIVGQNPDGHIPVSAFFYSFFQMMGVRARHIFVLVAMDDQNWLLDHPCSDQGIKFIQEPRILVCPQESGKLVLGEDALAEFDI